MSPFARVVGMADTADSNSAAERREGSTPSSGTTYFTRFSRGLARLAAGDALRDEAAKMADARSLLMPCFLAIFDATALNPGCFFMATIGGVKTRLVKRVCKRATHRQHVLL